MKYIAHLDENGREQSIVEHLYGTANLAGKFAGKFGKEDWGYCAGMLHDIGKYSEAFQKRIRGNNNKMVDHSTAGAVECRSKGGFHSCLEYCIAGHHAGLPDYGEVGVGNCGSTLLSRRKRCLEDYQAYRNEIEIPELKTEPFDINKNKNFPFSLSVFMRMIYSCLVDADFLDTEAFMNNNEVERDSGEKIEVLLGKLKTHIDKWLENEEKDTINARRTEILKACLKKGMRQQGLFHLTVPTGGGKTIASLAFALRHAVEHHMDRVIYVIPYTSIIEQNAKIFRDILGEQNVLENHCNVDYEASEELKAMQLASENWDKPIVVTTNVQFFESLYANKSSKCRKLHNIANSVIILDEAQMLPNDYLKPCVAMIEELIRNYRASVVLCTATQPALDQFFQSEMRGMELCPRMEEQFEFFRRTSLENIGKLTESDMVCRLEGEQQALCIVNTKKRAQSIYGKLEGEGIYHLSTSMYPHHRKDVLKDIRERLASGKRCIVVSTSLVEAGVDLDFQTVYRQLSGTDSIIQAAGRCNREGRRTVEESKVYIFQFDEKEYIPGQRLQMDITKDLLGEGLDISSLKNIRKYFEALYHFRGESLDKKKIMDAFSGKGHNFAKVGKEFKLIEQDTKTVFIPKEEEAVRLLEQIERYGFTRRGMRQANQYCVQIYEGEFEKFYSAGMLSEVSEDITDFYKLVDLEMYSEKMGLDLSVELGEACFF